MTWPQDPIGPRVVTIGVGLLGAVVSVTLVKDLTPLQKLVMVITGGVIAAIFSPPVIAWVSVPNERWAYAIAFFIGAIGWALMGKLIQTVRTADLWGLISDIARSWFTRR